MKDCRDYVLYFSGDRFQVRKQLTCEIQLTFLLSHAKIVNKCGKEKYCSTVVLL